jgi:hypothetical protein
MKCGECGGSGVAERIGGYDRPCDACHGEGVIVRTAPADRCGEAGETAQQARPEGRERGAAKQQAPNPSTLSLIEQAAKAAGDTLRSATHLDEGLIHDTEEAVRSVLQAAELIEGLLAALSSPPVEQARLGVEQLKTWLREHYPLRSWEDCERNAVELANFIAASPPPVPDEPHNYGCQCPQCIRNTFQPAADERLRKALEEIADQKIGCELELHEFLSADWQTGFECCVKRAREALAASPTPERDPEFISQSDLIEMAGKRAVSDKKEGGGL